MHFRLQVEEGEGKIHLVWEKMSLVYLPTKKKTVFLQSNLLPSFHVLLCVIQNAQHQQTAAEARELSGLCTRSGFGCHKIIT